mgnify:CR=1 FL=1
MKDRPLQRGEILFSKATGFGFQIPVMERCSDAGRWRGGIYWEPHSSAFIRDGNKKLSDTEAPAAGTLQQRKDLLQCVSALLTNDDLDLRDATCLPPCGTKLYGNCM